MQSILTVVAPRCGRRVIDHFFCEVPALLKLACTDTTVNEAELNVLGALLLLVPLSLILGTYVLIAQAVMKLGSAESRWKAFDTCASHLLVVFLLYFTAISMYVQPPSSYSGQAQDHGSVLRHHHTHSQPFHLRLEEQRCEGCPAQGTDQGVLGQDKVRAKERPKKRIESHVFMSWKMLELELMRKHASNTQSSEE